MHPTLERVLERFRTWEANAARVLVAWELAGAEANQQLVSAQVDGAVQLVDPAGETTLVIVGRDASVIRMFLSERCLFQTLIMGSEEPANVAEVDSMIRIAFPNGEQCFVTFYRPLS